MTLPILFHQARAPDRHQAKRGLQIGPEIAVGDGALGFWKASRNPTTAMLGAQHGQYPGQGTALGASRQQRDSRQVYLASNRTSDAAAIDVFANNTAPDADGQTNDRRNRLTMKKNASLSHPSFAVDRNARQGSRRRPAGFRGP